jgi:GAF domain-containing protein
MVALVVASNSERESPGRKAVSAARDEKPGAEPAHELQMIAADNGKGRDEITRLVATEPHYQVLFERMMEVTKRFVDFDWANLFIFSPNREYSRILCGYGQPIKYQTRWFPTDQQYVGWIDRPETWMEDFKEDIQTGPAPHLLERPDYKIALEAGTRALIVLPVRLGGEIKGGLCLLSKQRGIYGAETRGILECLTLDQALLSVFYAAERAEMQFVSDLVKKIADSKDLRDLARTVVTSLARFYAFDNTAIFKVNMLRERFELLAQELGFEGGNTMPEGFTQSLDQGLLGLTLRRGERIILNDIEDASEEAQHYIPLAPEIRSELCIPIRLLGRILWILNVEDRRKGAFTQIEFETLQGIIQQIQVILNHMFQRDILFQVLDMLPDAVVVIRQNGIIARTNKNANRMFERDAEREDITRFFDDPDAKANFAVGRSAPSMTTVKGAHGKKTPVLVSKFTLPEEYDHVVLVFHDVSKLQWKIDFEGLKAALAETVGQVRVPISLLASYVQQIEQRVDDEKLKDLTRKALRQIGRVELTYDRLLASYNAQALPPTEKVSFDINSALEHILNDLPKLERKAVSLATASPAIANVDPYRAVFALNSMLAYLLRARTNTERIAINVRSADGTVEVAMSGAVHPSSPQGELATLIENTRIQIALGQDALERIAQECEGSFERTRQAGGRERLSLRLAAAH